MFYPYFTDDWNMVQYMVVHCQWNRRLFKDNQKYQKENLENLFTPSSLSLLFMHFAPLLFYDKIKFAVYAISIFTFWDNMKDQCQGKYHINIICDVYK